jgi:hypothetical protein
MRIVIALIACAFLLWLVGVGELLDTLANARPEYLVYLLLLSIVMIWASCLKWQLFLRASGADVPMLRLMRYYTISYFFNTFTPSYIGGDVARSYHVGKYMGSQRDALVATFLERFTGLLAMSLLGVASVCFGVDATKDLRVSILLVGLVAVLLAAACFSTVFGRLCFSICYAVLARLPEGRIGKVLVKTARSFDEGLSHARSNLPLLSKALVLSFFFHLLTVINTYLAAKAVAWDGAEFGSLFVVVPLVLLVGMVPITPGGLGIQEGAFLFLLQRVGATQAQGLSVGVVLRAKIVILALVGCLLLILDRRGDECERDTERVTSLREKVCE